MSGALVRGARLMMLTPVSERVTLGAQTIDEGADGGEEERQHPEHRGDECCNRHHDGAKRAEHEPERAKDGMDEAIADSPHGPPC